MLFRRIPLGSGWVWVQSQPASWGGNVSARPSGQMLDVTSTGLWVDARLNHSADLSMWLEAPSPVAGPGEPAPPAVQGRWCYPSEGCRGTGWEGGSLGAPLPGRYSSFAWPVPGSTGDRIVVGLEGGALLDFEDSGNFRVISWVEEGREARTRSSRNPATPSRKAGSRARRRGVMKPRWSG